MDWLAGAPTTASASNQRRSTGPGKRSVPIRSRPEARTIPTNTTTASSFTPTSIAPPVDSVPGIASNSKFSGASNSAMTSSPRLVEASFQWWSVYCPAPKRATVIAVESRKGKYGNASRLRQSVRTSAIEHPTMSNPPTSSPQRMFFSSMNADSTPPRCGEGSVGSGDGMTVPSTGGNSLG